MVAFWAPQVEASLAAVSQLEKIADQLGDSVKLVKIDTYRNERVAKRYGIEEIPSLLFFNRGKVAAKITGTFSQQAVIDQINSLKE